MLRLFKLFLSQSYEYIGNFEQAYMVANSSRTDNWK